MMADGQPPIGSTVVAPDLLRADDPLAWHRLDDLPPSSMRRRRRVDVVPGDVITGEALIIDAMFRDSCQTPDDTEVVVHEYTLDASVDTHTATIADIRAVPACCRSPSARRPPTRFPC